MNKVHVTPLQFEKFGIKIVTGKPSKVLAYIDEQITNARSIVSAAVRKDDRDSMVVYIDGFEGSVTEAIAAIPANVLKSILAGYNTDDWGFLNLVSSLGSKLDVVVGSKLMETYKSVQRFAGRFASKIFTKGSYLAGSPDQSYTLMLIGPDGERTAYAWNWSDAKNQNVVLAQPFDTELTRYTVAGKNLVAVLEGTGQIATMTRKDVGNLINGNAASWQRHDLGVDVQIDDLSIGIETGNDLYTLVATGTFEGKKSIQVLHAAYSDGEIEIANPGSPVELDTDTAQLGSVVRIDQDAATFVNYNGGDNTVTRVPTNLLPQQVQETFRAAA